jgi:hypothetical protein
MMCIRVLLFHPYKKVPMLAERVGGVPNASALSRNYSCTGSHVDRDENGTNPCNLLNVTENTAPF